MKNRVFSAGLFWEAFRQLKIVGILGCVIYVFLCIFVPTGINISESAYYVNVGRYASDALEFMPEEMLLAGIFISLIFVPVMMLVAFQFLNKRNSCDFYHAIPVKRLPMYMSILLAVLVWTLMMILIPAAVLGIMCGALPYVHVTARSLLLVGLNVLAAAVFVMGVFSIGIALSGTLFTNILVSLIIMLIPRLLFIAYMTIIGNVAVYYPVDGMLELFFSKTNVISRLIVFMTGYEGELGLTTVFFSAAEGIIYLVVGGVVFNHRKSETAQKPSLTNRVQIILRMIPAYLCGTVGAGFLLYYFNYRKYYVSVYYEKEYLFFGIVFMAVSILLYFIYELLTARKWRAVLKSFKQLPVLVVLVAATFFVLKFVTYRIEAYRIDTDEVKYIEIKEISYLSEDFEKEWDKLDRKIYDSEYIDKIADIYNKQADRTEDAYTTAAETQCEISVKQGGAVYNRIVYIPDYLLSDIIDMIDEHNGWTAGMQLPEYSAGMYLEMNMGVIEFDSSQTEQIYNCLKREIEENNNLMNVFMTDWEYEIATMYVNQRLDLRDSYYLTYGIPISYKTPETLGLLSDFAGGGENLEDFITAIGECDNANGEMTINVITKDEIEAFWVNIYSGDDVLGRYAELAEILDKYGQKGCAAGAGTVIMKGYVYLEDYDDYYLTGSDYFYEVYSLSDEGMELFKEICTEIGEYWD